jgi:hypothetical protein
VLAALALWSFGASPAAAAFELAVQDDSLAYSARPADRELLIAQARALHATTVRLNVNWGGWPAQRPGLDTGRSPSCVA